MEDAITLSVWRFNPSREKEGRFQTYKIPNDIAAGMTIVDGLRYIQENIEPSLSFYYSCELARCRGCLMEANGSAVFACTEPLQNGQIIEPLKNLPVIKDLAVKFLNAEIILDEEKCISCEECVQACPMDIYVMIENKESVSVRSGIIKCLSGHAIDCIGCKRCEEVCSVEAIQIQFIKN